MWEFSAMVNEALEGVESIIIRRGKNKNCSNKTLQELCPKLNNILNQFIGDDDIYPGKGRLLNFPICDLFHEIAQSNKSTTIFELDCNNTNILARTDGTKPLGQTKRRNSNSQIHVYFNYDICDKSCLEIAAVLVHEALHARFNDLIFNRIPDGLEGSNLSMSNYNQYWKDICENNYDNYNNQHDIIALFYVDEIAKAMHKAFGFQGEWEDYKYWAYLGLGVEMAELAGSQVITLHKFNESLIQWNNVRDNVIVNCD